MVLTWPALYAVLFIYRSTVSVLAIGFVTQFTTLGDSSGYALMSIDDLGEKTSTSVFSAGAIPFYFGYLLRPLLVFGENFYLLSIAFQAIAFTGIVMLLRSLEPGLRRGIAPFFFIPSFTVWTAIPGKETFVVLFVCLMLKGMADRAAGRSLVLWQLAIAAGGIFLFKPQFFAAILFLLGLGLVARYVPQRAIFVVGAFCVTLLILFAVRPLIEELAPTLMISHFTGDNTRSTRPPFWTEPSDYFDKSLEGMFLAFIGPTIGEVRISVVHLFSFVESSILLVAFGVMMWRNLPRAPVYAFVLGLGTIFWTLFPNYGTGVMNPGTAIRYRAGWIPIIFFCVAVLMTERFGRMLIERRRRKESAPPTVAAQVSRVSPA